MDARFVNDISRDNRLARFAPDSAGERHSHFDVQIIANAFFVIERAMFAPDLDRARD